ncbi:MAG: hypothetical protein FJ027_24105, partial [Candidatus Rokubacteria bacterium]|nr:hypothetical protein [Candidatus Rokubacteria bacterium]
GVIEAVGSVAAGGAATSTGIVPGDPAARVLAAYGAAPAVDTIQSLSLWTYPVSALVVAVGGGRVQSAWTGRRSGQ